MEMLRSGERNFPLISLYDEKCVLERASLRGINANLARADFTGADLFIDRYMTGILF